MLKTRPTLKTAFLVLGGTWYINLSTPRILCSLYNVGSCVMKKRGISGGGLIMHKFWVYSN
jgi:hypothetical protein